MDCPFDATQLRVIDRHGVEIDWCPTCKGVWLERGELDKLLDRAAGELEQASRATLPPPAAAVPTPFPQGPAPAPAPYPTPTERRPQERRWDDDDDDDRRFGERRYDDDDRRYDDRGYPRKKRKSILSEIFDFD